jgi:hypothetical protein
MSKRGETGWVSKNQLPPAIPPYKTPRQLKTNNTRKARASQCVRKEVIEVSESERQDVVDVTETEQKESDSQDETQFGVVWEKLVPVVVSTEEYSDSVWCGLEDPPIVGESGKGTLPISYVGHPWKDTTYPYHAFVPETEDQASDSEDDNVPVSQILALENSSKKTMPELPIGKACVGHVILKQFETGVFKGTVMTATKLRGRYLYHIVYEDGDSEDLNDKELKAGHEMYNSQTEETFQSSSTTNLQDDIESETLHSGGETEESEYGMSDEEDNRVRKKKRGIGRGTKKIREPKHLGKKNKTRAIECGIK